MPTDNSAQGAFSDAAIREWNDHVEAMMRGVAHSLNNRAAALSAVLELSRERDEDPAGTNAILRTELARVRDMASAVRLMGPQRAGAEAFAPEDVVEQASSLMRLDSDQTLPLTIEARGAPPVRAERWMFIRALVILGVRARPTATGANLITMRLGAEDDWLVVELVDARAGESRYLTELVAAMDGELAADRGFRLPTLAVVRRREGR